MSLILLSVIKTSVLPAGMVAVVVKELEVISPEEVLCVSSAGAARIKSELARACLSGNRLRGLMVSGKVICWPWLRPWAVSRSFWAWARALGLVLLMAVRIWALNT